MLSDLLLGNHTHGIMFQILVSLGKELPPSEKSKQDEFEMVSKKKPSSDQVLWKEISDRQMVNTVSGDIVSSEQVVARGSGQSSPKSVSSGIGSSERGGETETENDQGQLF